MAFAIDNFNRWNERIVVTAEPLTGAGAISEIIAVNLTPNKLLVSDASGKIIVSSLVSATEASYLQGVSSNIQDQLDAKQATLTLGNLTEATSSVLTITGGTSAIIGSGLTIQVKAATSGQGGYLSAADWTTFNSKQTSSLASGYVLIGNGSAQAVDTGSLGDISASAGGGLAIKAGIIDNADISASAAITRSKTASGTAYRILANNASGVMSENAAITASRAVVSDANGQLVHATTTTTQINYLSTTTSDVQVQLSTLITGVTTNAIVRAPTITEDLYCIGWDNTAGEYTLIDPVLQGIPAGGTANYALVKNTGTDYDASWTQLSLDTHIADVTALAADVNILAGANAAGITSTEFGYINGVTSAIQTQLDNKQSSSLAQNAIWIGNSSGIATQLAAGTTGYVLTSVGGVPQWQPASGGVSDGDYGDIILSGGATSWTIDATLSKAWTGVHSFLDNSFSLKDNSDTTKILAFELSGITTATTRTLTIPNASGTIALNPMTTGGDIVYGGASGTPTRLANGSSGQVLTSAGGTSAPTWTTPAVSGLTTNRIPFATSSTTLGDDSALTWDSSNNALTIDGSRFHTRTTALRGLFFGITAGNFTLTGADNTGVGNLVLTSLTSGIGNTSLGSDAGRSITDGLENTSIGFNTNELVTTGDFNVSVGYNAGASITTANNNTFIGTSSGVSSTGSNNVFLGYGNGGVANSGSGNILVGYSLDAQSSSGSDQLSIQNAIFGSGNSGTGTTVSSGNIGFWATSWGSSAAKVVAIGNGTAPTTSIANGIQIFSKDSSDGATNATLGLYTEQAVEAIGTFTASHKLKIWINGTEYWISLDAV